MANKATARIESALTGKQAAAIAALVSEPTMKDAAARAGVVESTLWRWLQLAEFQKAYQEARRETVKHALVKMQSAASQAVDVMTEIMGNKEASDFARLAAAKSVLEFSVKAVELEDLAARIAELERIAEMQRNGDKSNKKG